MSRSSRPVRRGLTTRSILISLMVIALTVVGAQTAGAATQPQRITRCGQTITKSTAYLVRDLVCSTGLITRGDTVLDLRGHRLQGPGAESAITVEGDVDRFLDVSVRNGRIDHWDTAVSSTFGGVTVSHLKLDHNTYGLYCYKGTCTVSDSMFSANGVGAFVFDGGLSVTRSLFSHNVVGSEVGIGSGQQGTYSQSTFIENGVGVKVGSDGQAYVSTSLFSGNTVGVQSIGDGTAYLTSNVFLLNGDGVYISASEIAPPSELKGNRAYRNTGYGIYAPGSVDLGGNRGYANGKACVGVTCTA